MKNSYSTLLSKMLTSHLVMVAPNVDAFCKRLGYSGRTTFYNITNGKSNQLSEFRNKLKSNYAVEEADFENIDKIISNYRRYSMLLSGISIKDFWVRLFTEDESEDLIRFQIQDGDTFFRVAAYYYLRQAYESFPQRSMSYEGKCMELISQCMGMLKEKFPHHDLSIAEQIMCACDSHHLTIYWLTNWLTAVMTHLHDPKRHIATDSLLKLPDLESREYWQGANKDVYILSTFNRINKSYTIYSFDSSEWGGPGPVFSIYFYENGKCVLARLNAETPDFVSGTYSYKAETLEFNWHSEYNPTGLGNRWTKRSIAKSKALRDFNNSVTDELLLQLELQAQDLEPVNDACISDVMCSRISVTICMVNGHKYTLNTAGYPMLRKISPYDEVALYRKSSSNTVYIVWPQWNLRLPIHSFIEWE